MASLYFLITPSGSFWWRDVMTLSEEFRKIGSCKVNDGLTVMFWKDLWDLGVLQWQFPQLFSFVKNKNISVAKFLSQDAYQNFHTPLSDIAAGQLQDLSVLIQSLVVNNNSSDVWSYIWKSSDFYTKKAYTALKGTQTVSKIFKWMWKSCAQGKHKFFFWLLLKDRLNTRSLLRRKNMVLQDYNCVLCSGHSEETLAHLFFPCPFSVQCWQYLGITWNLSFLVSDMITSALRLFGRKIFREIAIVACWSIWVHRNSIIFDGDSVSFARWKLFFRKEIERVALRAKPSLKMELDLWICNSL